MGEINTGLALLISAISIVGTVVVVTMYFSGTKSDVENLKEKVKDLEDTIYKDMAENIKKITESLIVVQSDLKHLRTDQRPISVDKGDIQSLIQAFVQISENNANSGK
jgi:hypothetical protein